MSIRTALIGGLSVLLLVSSAVLAIVGIRAIRQDVVREAQARVDRDLSLVANLYETDLELTAERFRSEIGYLDLVRPALTAGLADEPGDELERRLLSVRQSLGFAVLGIADGTGTRIAGATGEPGRTEGTEPLLRAALAGAPSHGTVLVSADRLVAEGGAALAASQRVGLPGDGSDEGTASALFQWFALPIRDDDGRILGAAYGGRALNHDEALVDRFAGTLYGDRVHAGKPVGTVTIFLGDTRVATNVRDREGARAVGTRVSDVVRTRVLEEGRPWHDRAWVVDAWYLSGYRPLADPAGRTIGMLYVGLLEAPYDELRTGAIRRFALPAFILIALAWIGSVLVVERITSPLERLRESAAVIANGEWDRTVEVGPSYTEIRSLSEALVQMQTAIGRRDRELRGRNAELAETNEKLAETNEKLEVANENYRNTLGFVTHELKAPLANMQSHIELVVEGHGGALTERGRDLLLRVRRNCEDLQGMVKDYLDLSRAERGGFHPVLRSIDLRTEVIEPSVALSDGLFRSRAIHLDVNDSGGPTLHPGLPVRAASITVDADPELLRIALGNLLSNAAKYGRDGGRAELALRLEEDAVTVSVENDGEGFRPEEAEQLFTKFTRLRNANTKTKKGSGLGLFLTARIVEAHGGRVWAESEPGQWARFGFRLPLHPPVPSDA